MNSPFLHRLRIEHTAWWTASLPALTHTDHDYQPKGSLINNLSTSNTYTLYSAHLPAVDTQVTLLNMTYNIVP